MKAVLISQIQSNTSTVFDISCFAHCVVRDHRLERMEAMEKQIASLTGLVQSVLTRAPDSDST